MHAILCTSFRAGYQGYHLHVYTSFSHIGMGGACVDSNSAQRHMIGCDSRKEPLLPEDRVFAWNSLWQQCTADSFLSHFIPSMSLCFCFLFFYILFVFQTATAFLAKYSASDVVQVSIPGESSALWAISPPSRDLLLHGLAGKSDIEMRFRWSVARWVVGCGVFRLKQWESEIYCDRLFPIHE